MMVFTNKPKYTNELIFTRHCKNFDHFLPVGISNQYYDKNNILLGICIVDNANTENNKYIIYR